MELVTQEEQRWWRQEGRMRGRLVGGDVNTVEHLRQRGDIVKETSLMYLKI